MKKPKYLFIVEKPSLKRNVEGVYKKVKQELPYEADFLSCAGHLVRLALPNEYDPPLEELPLFPLDFKLMPIEETKSLLHAIGTQLKTVKYDAVVNCCDPEREGQYIFFLIVSYLHCRLPQKRFWSNDQSYNAVVYALKNLRENESNQGLLKSDPQLKNLTLASRLRGENDWLVGMNYSRALGVASGRVRTTTLAIVVQRDLEIENFKETTVYEVDAEYKGFDEKRATLQSSQTVTEKDKNGNLVEKTTMQPTQFATKEEALSFIQEQLKQTATVSSVEQKVVKKKAPPLFTLTDVQSEASKAFGYNVSHTLEICQSLYEAKILSYPRTDCPYISTEMTENFPSMLKAVACIPSLSPLVEQVDRGVFEEIRKNKHYVNDEKMAESGHSALSPTDTTFDFGTLTLEQKNVLAMIYKRFLAIFFPPVVQENTVILFDNHSYLFKMTGKKTLQRGFLDVFGTKTEDVILPSCKEGDCVSVLSHEARGVTSKPPQHFDEGTLVKAMENPAKYLVNKDLKDTIQKAKGIGTVATRANIIAKLFEKDRNGVSQCEHKKCKGKADVIVSTEFGRKVIKHLEGQNITRVDMTAMWEDKLAMVANGKLSFADYEADMKETVFHDTQTFLKLGKVGSQGAKDLGRCPFCGNVLANGKNGIYCKGNYNKEAPCRFSINDKTKEILGKWHVELNGKNTLLLCEGKYLVSERGVILTPIKTEKGYLGFDIDTSKQKSMPSHFSKPHKPKGVAK